MASAKTWSRKRLALSEPGVASKTPSAPFDTQHEESPLPVGPAETRLRRTERYSLVIQATTNVLVVILAIAALWLARETYQDQANINKSQLDLNRLERERFERRYASRVSFWDATETPDPPQRSVQIVLQNRSSVPIVISEIASHQFSMQSATGVFDDFRLTIEDVVLWPCSINRIDIPFQEVGRYVATVDRILNQADSEFRLVGWSTAEVRFSDGVTHWVLSGTGLAKAANPNASKPYSIKPVIARPSALMHLYRLKDSAGGDTALGVPLERQSASDCGESG